MDIYIYPNLCFHHTPPNLINHCSKLLFRPSQNSGHISSFAAIFSHYILITETLDLHSNTFRKYSKSGHIGDYDNVPKYQWPIHYLTGPIFPPLDIGVIKNWRSSIVTKYAEISGCSCAINTSLLCYVSVLAANIILRTSLNNENGPFRAPMSTWVRWYRLLSPSLGKWTIALLPVESRIPSISAILRYVHLEP